MELILHIKKRRQPSHFIDNFFKGAQKNVGFKPSVNYLSIFLGVGGLRATNTEEVLEVEGWALWWQRPQ